MVRMQVASGERAWFVIFITLLLAVCVFSTAAVFLAAPGPREAFPPGTGESWSHAIMPSSVARMSPPASRGEVAPYYEDGDGFLEAWTAALKALPGSYPGAPAYMSSLRGGGRWEERTPARTPLFILDGFVTGDLEAALGMNAGRHAALKAWRLYRADGGGSAVWIWDVLACFHVPGRARGWCARVRVLGDTRDARRPVLAVLAARAAGVVSESVLALPADGVLAAGPASSTPAYVPFLYSSYVRTPASSPPSSFVDVTSSSSLEDQ